MLILFDYDVLVSFDCVLYALLNDQVVVRVFDELEVFLDLLLAVV